MPMAFPLKLEDVTAVLAGVVVQHMSADPLADSEAACTTVRAYK
jgi:hypothetical protein